ncbi:MAG TPA: protein kinase [Vicinamibacterales bacterium]|nr:protein kinase [Vicinamibacterales bacterium]
MPIPPGSQLGPYTITSALGAGGMGEVYRARDGRLGRDVAVKVLPASSSTDADRLQRFEQEARAAAALNHPNILALYDIGRTETGPYIVSELLNGETLRSALDRGAMPVRKAIEYAVQIARGLAAAHERGIVHRDLKPENVFVTSDGHVKILDFGLAKLVDPEPAFAGGSMLPTTPPPTTPGVVLGTVGYMAPEQVRGLPADHRADIFAFGALLYEMLAGRRAFRRDTPAETMTAILKEDPADLSIGGAAVPASVQRLVGRCLEKNPAARFQSAGDLAFALDTFSSSSSSGPISMATLAAAPRRRYGRLAWVIAPVSVIALFVGWLIYMRPAAEEGRLLRFTISTPEGWRPDLTSSVEIPIAVSPDGRFVAGRARTDAGEQALWVRALDTLDSRILPGTEEASAFFWSPDNRSLAFVSNGKLRRIDVAGGPATVLCDLPLALPLALGGAWSAAGVIVLGSTSGLQQVASTGGTLTAALALAPDEALHSLPVFFPDGEHFLFVAAIGAEVRGGSRRRVFAARLGSQDRTLLFDTDRYVTPVGIANGHLLFVRGNSLVAQPFDETRMALSGDAVSVIDRIQLMPDRPYGVVSIAPDESRAVLAIMDAARRTRDIWLFDLTRAIRTRFTFDAGEERTAIWSPGSDRLVYNAQRKATERDLYVKASNGSGTETTLLADGLSKDAMSWSQDGRFLLYRVSAKTRNDIWVQPLDGPSKPYPFIATEFDENYGRFSPDGRWVAYSSDASGRLEVYVAPFPGPGGKWQLSTTGGSYPRWRQDGRVLFYLAPDNTMMSVAVDGTTSGFQSDAARALFHAPIALQVGYQYAVTRDGQRFLLNTAASSSAPVAVIDGWPRLLKK